MTKEKILEVAKKFTNDKYNEYCEMVDDFEDKCNELAHYIESGDPWDNIDVYKRNGLLPSDFPDSIDDCTSDQSDQVDIAIVKDYINYGIKEEGTIALAVSYILHEYFEDWLDKI